MCRTSPPPLTTGSPTGKGSAFQRRYTARIRDTALNAEQLIEGLCADINAASLAEVAVFDKASGAPQRVDPGDEYLIHVPGPWKCPVRVVKRTPRSFRFATLRGHLEAGEIEFRATDAEQSGVVFTIESWTRSGDRLADVLYDRLGIAKEMQLHMWVHFCRRVAELCGGQMTGEVEVYTECSGVAGDARFRPALVTDALAAVITGAFRLAARLRGGRPLCARTWTWGRPCGRSSHLCPGGACPSSARSPPLPDPTAEAERTWIGPAPAVADGRRQAAERRLFRASAERSLARRRVVEANKHERAVHLPSIFQVHPSDAGSKGSKVLHPKAARHSLGG